MFMRRSLVLFTILSIISISAIAQTQSTFSGWGALFMSWKLDPRFSIVFDGQVRSNNEWKEVQSFIARPGLQYKINKNRNMFVTLGYGYIGNHRRISGVDGWGPEHRIWEQFILNQSFKPGGHALSLQHRFRLEQRFISRSFLGVNELETRGYDFAQRLRYFARAIYPLKKSNAFTKGSFISLQNELFLNISNTNAVNGKFFDQNRAYGSIGYRFSPVFDLEIGYMNQYISGRTSNTSNSIIQLAGYLRI
jgi:hypothetical protein